MQHDETRSRDTPTPQNLPAADDPERGDVPGWVLVTLMTAGLPVSASVA